MIVDPHHHLWVHPDEAVHDARAARRHRRPSPTSRKTVFVECGSGYRTDGPEAFRPVGETDFVVAADPDGFIAGIVGFADLTRPEVADVLAAHVEAGQGRFRGIRHASAHDAEPGHPRVAHQAAARPARPGRLPARVRRARRRRAAASTPGCSTPSSPSSSTCAAPCPTRRSCSTTSAARSASARTPAGATRCSPAGGESMTDVAACDNVVLKLGGIGMADLRDGLAPRRAARRREQLVEAWGEPIRWCIETFGPERCMFESNFPVDKVSCTYADLWGAFDADRRRRQRRRARRPVRRHRDARLPPLSTPFAVRSPGCDDGRMLPSRSLGASGPEVSVMSLGSWRTFERISRDEGLAVMRAAREAGVTLLDDARYDDETGTAPIPTGWSEVVFGELFRGAGWDARRGHGRATSCGGSTGRTRTRRPSSTARSSGWASTTSTSSTPSPRRRRRPSRSSSSRSPG